MPDEPASTPSRQDLDERSARRRARRTAAARAAARAGGTLSLVAVLLGAPGLPGASRDVPATAAVQAQAPDAR